MFGENRGFSGLVSAQTHASSTPKTKVTDFQRLIRATHVRFALRLLLVSLLDGTGLFSSSEADESPEYVSEPLQGFT